MNMHSVTDWHPDTSLDTFPFLKKHTPLIADRIPWMRGTDEKISLTQKLLTRSRTKKRIKDW